MVEQVDLEFQKLLMSRKRHLTEEEKRQIVTDYLSRSCTVEQLCKRYGVGHSSVYKWISNFATVGHCQRKVRTAARCKQNPLPMAKKQQKTTETDAEELARLREENRRLSEALKMAEWMNHAKDVMIDEAEKTFNIPIRKKSGAKQ